MLAHGPIDEKCRLGNLDPICLKLAPIICLKPDWITNQYHWFYLSFLLHGFEQGTDHNGLSWQRLLETDQLYRVMVPEIMSMQSLGMLVL